MRRRLLIGGSIIGALVICAAVVLWVYVSGSSAQSEGAAKAAAPYRQSKWVKQWPKNKVELGVSIEALLKDGSTQAWERLSDLYKGADRSTKRKILQKASDLPDLKQALAYVVASVGDDATPVEQDPMIEEAAELLKDRWTRPEELEYGRRFMLMQKTDKRKWVVAKSMIAFAAELREDSKFQVQKSRLASKLIDLHSSTSNQFVRASIADGMREMGDKDVALILSKGPNVKMDELEVARREKAAQAETWAKLNQGE